MSLWSVINLLVLCFVQANSECQGTIKPMYVAIKHESSFNTVAIFLIFIFTAVSCTNAAVLVAEPWPKHYLFVPRGSTVQINCTDRTGNYFWSVDIASDASGIQYRTGDEQLLTHGVFELPPVPLETAGKLRTLRLLINDTARNNGTKVFCSSGESTSVYVFGMSTPKLAQYPLLHAIRYFFIQTANST